MIAYGLGILGVILMLGPLGRIGLIHGFSVDLITIYLWALTWFYSGRLALRVAIFCGILIDMVSFLPFGIWTIGLAGQVLLIDWLKKRFFETSSLVQSILSLAASTAWLALIMSVAARGIELTPIGLGILANVAFGLVLYYVFAVRLRLFSRWAGRRLS